MELFGHAGYFSTWTSIDLGHQSQRQSLLQHPTFIGASAGINASVVGFLFLALYDPVFMSAVYNYTDLSIVVMGFLGLKLFKPPILLLISMFILLGFV